MFSSSDVRRNIRMFLLLPKLSWRWREGDKLDDILNLNWLQYQDSYVFILIIKISPINVDHCIWQHVGVMMSEMTFVTSGSEAAGRQMFLWITPQRPERQQQPGRNLEQNHQRSFQNKGFSSKYKLLQRLYQSVLQQFEGNLWPKTLCHRRTICGQKFTYPHRCHVCT